MESRSSSEVAQEREARLIEVASALLEAAPGQELNIVVLNKALFYADLVALRDLGHTLTRTTYIALDQGPVVAKYPARLLRPLEKAGIATQRTVEGSPAKPVRLVGPVPARRYLTHEGLAIVSKVADFFAQKTSAKSSDFSHENLGWQLAHASKRRSNRPVPIDLQIALQQLADSDPWMDEPLSAETLGGIGRAAFESAEVW